MLTVAIVVIGLVVLCELSLEQLPKSGQRSNPPRPGL